MEMNFLLHSIKQQLAFFNKNSEKRLEGIFKFNDPSFLQIMEHLLGEDYLQFEFRSMTRVDIISMMVARERQRGTNRGSELGVEDTQGFRSEERSGAVNGKGGHEEKHRAETDVRTWRLLG
ncbi:hypothetical protein SUGI_0487340 [Cryptomeria japonica]|nr:hypothetical protein SUGI_0487340 [Cryptomeria japonica]